MNIVDSLKKLYEKLGGEIQNVKEVQTAPDMVNALADIVEGGGTSLVELYAKNPNPNNNSDISSMYLYKDDSFEESSRINKNELKEAFLNGCRINLIDNGDDVSYFVPVTFGFTTDPSSNEVGYIYCVQKNWSGTEPALSVFYSSEYRPGR